MLLFSVKQTFLSAYNEVEGKNKQTGMSALLRIPYERRCYKKKYKASSFSAV